MEGWVPDAARLAADSLLRRLAALHTGAAVDQVQVGRLCPRCASSGHGRPHALVAGRDRVWVTLARAGPLTLAAACTDAAVGVDVEAWGAFDGIDDEAVLHPRERAGSAHDRALTWVRKESLLKAVGVGLTVDPRAVRLGPASQPPRLVSWPGPGPVPVVAMRDLDVPGHAASLTVLAQREPRVSLRWAAPGGAPGPATPRGDRPRPGPSPAPGARRTGRS
ncbi:hypothetical protein GCM10027596_31280 [Nocardioides korecus]